MQGAGRVSEIFQLLRIDFFKSAPHEKNINQLHLKIICNQCCLKISEHYLTLKIHAMNKILLWYCFCILLNIYIPHLCTLKMHKFTQKA